MGKGWSQKPDARLNRAAVIREVSCSYCGALPGRRCFTVRAGLPTERTRLASHQERWDAWRALHSEPPTKEPQ
jgi:hypothetical protein